MFKFKLNTRTLVYLALLIACEIVLNRFLSISTNGTKIGFGFAPVVLCGMSLGPIAGAIVGGISDLLGAVAFPIGVYHPGFSIVNAAIGFVYGLFLYNSCKKNSSKMGVILFAIAAILIDCALGLFVNTYWISQLYSDRNYWMWFVSRIPQYLIGLPLRFIVITSLRPIALMLKKICRAK